MFEEHESKDIKSCFLSNKSLCYRFQKNSKNIVTSRKTDGVEVCMRMGLSDAELVPIRYSAHMAELSILTKDEVEFIFLENVWRFRDYKGIHDLVTNLQKELSDEVYQSLFSFILYCSKHEISLIIWIPFDESDKALDEMLATSNPLPETSGISICKECHEGLLKRMLSSDRACIISKSGRV